MNIKGVIFDLDETVIDSTSLKTFRDQRNWSACYAGAATCLVYDHMLDFLSHLSNLDLPIGFVTNSPRKYATTLLSTHNIRYNTLVAYHDCNLRKPHPAPMLKCAAQLGVEPSHILALGDDVKDIQAANAAGMISVAVTWGVSNRADLLDKSPQLIIDSGTKLLEFIRKAAE